MIAALKTHLWPVAALGLAGLLLWQTLRLADAQVDLARLGESHAALEAKRAARAQAQTEIKAGALLQHGAAQQENAHAYTQTIAKLEAGRAADAVRIAGLQHDVRASATRAAQAAGDAAACRSLADRHEQLGVLAARGAGVVGGLVGLVKQRDAEVKFLKEQVLLEKKLTDNLN